MITRSGIAILLLLGAAVPCFAVIPVAAEGVIASSACFSAVLKPGASTRWWPPKMLRIPA